MVVTLLSAKLREAGIPFVGVAVDDERNITIHYSDKATSEQKLAATTIAARLDVTLEARRAEKLYELSQWWHELERAGVTAAGIRLAATADDIAMLTGQFVLAQAAVQNGLKLISDPFIVIDVSGKVHQLTLPQLTGLLLTYGEQRTLKAQKYLAYQTQVARAASIAELDAITLE